MSGEYVIFLWLLLINFVIVLGYVVTGICLRRKKEGITQYILNGIIMLLCPVTGVLYFSLGTVIRHVFMRREADLEDVVFSKERVKAVPHADEESDRNMIPMEEALVVSDQISLRRLMLNVIRRDVQDVLRSISLGLNSEDSETAHYAASVLRDELNHFRATEQQLYEQTMGTEVSDEQRCRCACTLIDLMVQILPQQVFSDMEQKAYVFRMDEVCGYLYDHRPERMRAEYYETLIVQLSRLGEYSRAEEWCDRLSGQYPGELAAYSCPMKVYFASGQREKFFETLERLKCTDIALDNATLEMMRTLEPENADP